MFLQRFFIMAVAGSVIWGWVGRASRKNGRETRDLIGRTQDLISQNHSETIHVLARMDEPL